MASAEIGAFTCVYGALVELGKPSQVSVTYFNEVDKGGHFAAWEEPELFSQEVRAAFKKLR